MSGIQILKKRIEIKTIANYLLFALVFILLNFYLQPLIKKEYLPKEIERFNENVSWKIYLLICSSLLLFIVIFKAKTLHSKGEAVLVFLFLCIFTFVISTKLITNTSLYINQLSITGKEKEVLTVNLENFNGKKYAHLSGNKIFIDDSNEEYLEKIDEIRNKNGLKPLNEIGNRDTIHVVFKKGLFGFKYLK